ncbi:MAG: hypothetical protein AAGC96_17985 [Pseudomonadota bacterium]
MIDRDLGRYFYVLVKYLTLAGFAVNLNGPTTLSDRIRAKKWASRVFDEPYVQIGDQRSGSQAEGDLLITDEDHADQALSGMKTFQLIKGRRLTQQRQAYDMLFPYMLHPKYYADGRHLKVAQYRRQNRNIGLFFSGNYNERYRNPSILAKYGTLQRPMILDLLLEGLPPEQLFRTTPDFDTELAAGHYESQFVFVDNLQGNRVAKGQWLETLGQCRFFLACPGVDMPLSHNLVEAMSVGCIPFTQYGDFFDPPLRDGVDCVAHSGTDVVERARAALAMDARQIETLRQNTIAYYEQNLTVDAFARRVLDHPGQRVRLGMNFMPREGIH